jgi:hypothetical protein
VRQPPETPRTAGRTARRIERAAGSLATAAVSRMDATLPWFRGMPAEQRSWINLVLHAGIDSFVVWLRDPSPGLGGGAGAFATAPRELARTVTLQQTVELVRVAVETLEDASGELAAPGEEELLHDAVLRYSREIAFAAARVYARTAEERGAWDARLEALVVDAVLRGEDDHSMVSRAAALGWTDGRPVTVAAGQTPGGDPEPVLEGVQRAARRIGAHALAGVLRNQLVVVLGAADPPAAAATLADSFGPGPVVYGPVVADLAEAGRSAAAALAGLHAAPAWPEAPRPVAADRLLPERALAGDAAGAEQLVEEVYRPVVAAGGRLLQTLSVYLEAAGSLEATARVLFVHPNTVRYRLRRVTELTGRIPGDPRDGFALRVALAVGRLSDAGPAFGNTTRPLEETSKAVE